METTESSEESFRVDFFLYIVYQAISSIQNRFEQFTTYENIFGFLFNIKKLKYLNEEDLKSIVLTLKFF